MKKIIFILATLIFQTNLFSQTEIVGKAEFYKSIVSDWNILESFPDKTINKLRNKQSLILVLSFGLLMRLISDIRIKIVIV